jgi:hypothetical protein
MDSDYLFSSCGQPYTSIILAMYWHLIISEFRLILDCQVPTTQSLSEKKKRESARIIQLTGKWAEKDGQNLIDSESLTKGPNSSDLIQNKTGLSSQRI